MFILVGVRRVPSVHAPQRTMCLPPPLETTAHTTHAHGDMCIAFSPERYRLSRGLQSALCPSAYSFHSCRHHCCGAGAVPWLGIFLRISSIFQPVSVASARAS